MSYSLNYQIPCQMFGTFCAAVQEEFGLQTVH